MRSWRAGPRIPAPPRGSRRDPPHPHPGGGGRAAGRLSGPQCGGAHPLRRPAAAGGGGGDQRRPSLKKSEKTAPGQVVEVVLPEPEPVDVLPQNIPLDVVYEDSDVIVVNKPVGMVVHPAPGHPGRDPGQRPALPLRQYTLRNQRGAAAGHRPPHRRDTSGLIIAAKNDRAHLALAEQLQDHSLAGCTRRWRWAASGRTRARWTPPSAATRWTEEDGRGAPERAAGGDPLEGFGPILGCTHVECRLETGRTHQIRVHLASIGHPLLGDTVYGSKKPYPRPGRPVFTRPKTDFPASEGPGSGWSWSAPSPTGSRGCWTSWSGYLDNSITQQLRRTESG